MTPPEPLKPELQEFLDHCGAYYWLLMLDDHKYSRLQATPFYDTVRDLIGKHIFKPTNEKSSKKKASPTLKKHKRFFLVGGHIAHVVSQLVNMKILTGQ